MKGKLSFNPRHLISSTFSKVNEAKSLKDSLYRVLDPQVSLQDGPTTSLLPSPPDMKASTLSKAKGKGMGHLSITDG